jgi:hypothetical protein
MTWWKQGNLSEVDSEDVIKRTLVSSLTNDCDGTHATEVERKHLWGKRGFSQNWLRFMLGRGKGAHKHLKEIISQGMARSHLGSQQTGKWEVRDKNTHKHVQNVNTVILIYK